MNRNAYTLGLGLLALLVGAASCNRDGAKGDDKPATAPATTQAAAEPEPPAAKLDQAAIDKFGITVSKKLYPHVLDPTFVAPARVAFNAEAMANVGPTVIGRVADIKAKLGDNVKKGDVLLVIVSNDLGEAQSDYLLKRTTADTAAEAVEPMKVAYERARDLRAKTEGISLSEVQKREADFHAAEGASKAAKESFNAAVRKLHLLGMDDAAVAALAKSGSIEPKFVVHSPIDGRVIDRNVTLGQSVSPDKDALFVVADLSTLWVIADVPERQLKDVAVGARVRVTAAAIPGQSIEGSVAFVAPAADPATRSVQVRVAIPGGNAALRPGMFADAEFDLPAAADAEAVITVPEEAVQTIDGRPCVFVPDEDDKTNFIKRPVVVGAPVKGKIPILYGVNPKEKVVISGAAILKSQLGKPAAD